MDYLNDLTHWLNHGAKIISPKCEIQTFFVFLQKFLVEMTFNVLQNTIYQTSKQLRLILVLGIILVSASCKEENKETPAGEWRLKAVSRDALPGNRADRVQLSQNENAPVYLRFEKDNTFVAETPKKTLKGTWHMEPEQSILVLKTDGNRADTLKVEKQGKEISALEACIREPEGLIRLSYTKTE